MNTISAFIEQLTKIKNEHGDLPVYYKEQVEMDMINEGYMPTFFGAWLEIHFVKGTKVLAVAQY